MNNNIVRVICEGETELLFCKNLLRDYFAGKNILILPSALNKKGQAGGSVNIDRAKNDIGNSLKQNQITTLFVDYFRIDTKWTGYQNSLRLCSTKEKFDCMCKTTRDYFASEYSNKVGSGLFIPYFSMHEIAALYFSDIDILSKHIKVSADKIKESVKAYKTPEDINNGAESAPSKRLEKLATKFKKTITVLLIAHDIGIETMRKKCPCFDLWLKCLEDTVSTLKTPL